MQRGRREAAACEALIPFTDPSDLDATEKLLAQPIPAELADLPEYSGPNDGLVNTLLEAAQRIARGAVDDGLLLAKTVVDFRIADRRKAVHS